MVAKTAMRELRELSLVRPAVIVALATTSATSAMLRCMLDIVVAAEAPRVTNHDERDDQGSPRATIALSRQRRTLPRAPLNRPQLTDGGKLLENQQRRRMDDELQPDDVDRQVQAAETRRAGSAPQRSRAASGSSRGRRSSAADCGTAAALRRWRARWCESCRPAARWPRRPGRCACPLAHRDADIGGLQRRDVVDPVAGDRDDSPSDCRALTKASFCDRNRTRHHIDAPQRLRPFSPLSRSQLGPFDDHGCFPRRVRPRARPRRQSRW